MRLPSLSEVTLREAAGERYKDVYRTSGGGQVSLVPQKAATVGPRETWKAEKVSIWHAGNHDNPFGLRLTTLMIAKKIPDASVPMSLLSSHPNVQFNFYREGIGTCAVQMH